MYVLKRVVADVGFQEGDGGEVREFIGGVSIAVWGPIAQKSVLGGWNSRMRSKLVTGKIR
jgi:hypothetical protein